MRGDIQARRVADARSRVAQSAEKLQKLNPSKPISDSAQEVKAARSGRAEVRDVQEIEAHAELLEAVVKHLEKSSSKKANAKSEEE